MNSTAFCFWFQGVLDISEKEGAVSFNLDQLSKIQGNLKLALEDAKAAASGQTTFPGRPPGVRC